MNMIDCASQIKQQTAITLIQNGITHIGRYLPTSAWKGLTLPEVSVIQQAGLNLISIFEDGATKPTYFNHDQGVKDAYAAYKLAQSLGQPEGTVIYFTVDFDAQTKDFANILNYFQGLKDTLTSYKIGCYGKFEVVTLIKTKGLADYFWQTYAWSSGQHAKGLHLFQYKNDIAQYGLGFNIDLDQVENADCGGWTSVPTQKTESFIKTVKILNQTDIRDNPSHTSGYVKDALKDEMYNVIQIVNGWYQVAVSDTKKGWIDGLNISDLTQPKAQTYKVQTGQSLTKIASIFNTTVNQLLILNPNITNPNKIYVGQTIIVPK